MYILRWCIENPVRCEAGAAVRSTAMHGVTTDGLIVSRKGDSEVGTSEANIVATRPDAHQKEAATMMIVAMVAMGVCLSDGRY